MEISEIAIVAACLAFLITQIHLIRVARKLKKASEASWQKAERQIQESRDAIKDDIIAEIKGIEIPLPQAVLSLPDQLGSLPGNLGEVIKSQGEDQVKSLAEYFASNLEGAVNNIKSQIASMEEKYIQARRFGGDPKEAQAKGVESRKVNQIVQTLEDHVTGPGIAAKVNELAAFLMEVGQPELADWLDENHQAISAIERRIRANPQLAARLQAYQAKLQGGHAGSHSSGGML